MLDLRWPIGWMFLALGLLLLGFGVMRPHGALPVTFAVDLNVGWGALMALFGAGMASWARLSPQPAEEARGPQPQASGQDADAS